MGWGRENISIIKSNSRKQTNSSKKKETDLRNIIKMNINITKCLLVIFLTLDKDITSKRQTPE